MADDSKINKATATINAQVKPATFHDFLGQPQQSATPALGGVRPPPDVSPSATSDLGSERHVGNHLEGIPFYGSRGDAKRNNSDSFMISSKDKIPQGLMDSQDSQLLSKLLRYSGGERPKRPHEGEASYGMHQARPISASYISQNSADNNSSKWDRAAAGPTLQYPLKNPSGTGQIMPFMI